MDCRWEQFWGDWSNERGLVVLRAVLPRKDIRIRLGLDRLPIRFGRKLE